MAFELNDLQSSKEFRSLPLDDRLTALNAYFDQATDHFESPDRRQRMTYADMENMRSARNEVATREIYADIAPQALQRAQLLTGSSDKEVVQAKAQDIMRQAIFEPSGEIDMTSPRNVKGSDKILQDRILNEPELAKRFTKGGGDGVSVPVRRNLLKRLFFTSGETVGPELKEKLKNANTLARGYQDIDTTMEIGDGMKVHVRNHHDPRKRNQLKFSVDDPRLKEAGKYPIRFNVDKAELEGSSIKDVLAARAQDLKDGTEHSVFGDLQRAVRSGFVGFGGSALEGAGDFATTAILAFSGLGNDLDVPRLGDDDSAPNLARSLQRSAEGIREGQSMDTKVAKHLESDNLFTANRLMDMFGEGIGQLGGTLLTGGIGGLAGGASGAAAGAFSANFGAIVGETTGRALELGATPKDSRIAGIISGTIGAPMETIADVTAMKLIMGTGLMALADRGLITKVVTNGVLQSMIEGGTEFTQQIIANGTLKAMINDDLDITDGALESLVAGALVGAAAGGGGGFITGLKDRKLPETGNQNPPEVNDIVGDGRVKVADTIIKEAKDPEAEAKQRSRDPDIDRETLVEDQFAEAFAQELSASGHLDPAKLDDPTADPKKIVEEALDEFDQTPEQQVAQALLEKQSEEVDAIATETEDVIEPDGPVPLETPEADIPLRTRVAAEREKQGITPGETFLPLRDLVRRERKRQDALPPKDRTPLRDLVRAERARQGVELTADEDLQLDVLQGVIDKNPPKTDKEFEEVIVEVLAPLPPQTPQTPDALTLEADLVDPDQLALQPADKTLTDLDADIVLEDDDDGLGADPNPPVFDRIAKSPEYITAIDAAVEKASQDLARDLIATSPKAAAQFKEDVRSGEGDAGPAFDTLFNEVLEKVAPRAHRAIQEGAKSSLERDANVQARGVVRAAEIIDATQSEAPAQQAGLATSIFGEDGSDVSSDQTIAEIEKEITDTTDPTDNEEDITSIAFHKIANHPEFVKVFDREVEKEAQALAKETIAKGPEEVEFLRGQVEQGHVDAGSGFDDLAARVFKEVSLTSDLAGVVSEFKGPDVSPHLRGATRALEIIDAAASQETVEAPAPFSDPAPDLFRDVAERGRGSTDLGIPEGTQVPPSPTAASAATDPTPEFARPNPATTPAQPFPDRVQARLELILAGIFHIGQIRSNAYEGTLSNRQALALDRLRSGNDALSESLNKGVDFIASKRSVSREEFNKDKFGPSEIIFGTGRTEGVVIGRSANRTDLVTERQFSRQFKKLEKAIVAEIERFVVSGETDRAELLEAKLQEFRDKFPASLTRRQRLAETAFGYRKQWKKRRIGRPKAKIFDLIKARVEALDSSTLPLLSPSDFSRFMEEEVLLKPDDFTTKRNPDGTYTITLAGFEFDNLAPDPARLSRKLPGNVASRIEALRSGPFDTGFELRQAEANEAEALLARREALESFSDPVSPELRVGTPPTEERNNERRFDTEQGSVNSQLRTAALEWYWLERKKAKIPIFSPVTDFPVGPYAQLMGHGTDNLVRVMGFYDAEQAGIDDIRVERPGPGASEEFTANLRFQRVREDIDFANASTGAQRMADWQAGIQRMTEAAVTAYDTLAGPMLSSVKGDQKGAPIIAPELVEFAVYSRLKMRADGAPVTVTEQDVRRAIADTLAVDDPWISALYRQTFGEPRSFQDALKRGELPGFLPDDDIKKEKLIGKSEAAWGRPGDMPRDVSDRLESLSDIHKGIMGDIWVATNSRRQRLQTDEFAANPEDEFDVTAEETNLRREYNNSNTVRSMAFSRAKTLGLKAVNVGVPEGFQSDDFEFFRRYVLEAQIARESIIDYENPDRMEHISGDVGIAMLEGGAFGDIDINAMNDNLGFNSLSNAFDAADFDENAEASEGSVTRNMNNAKAAAIGEDYLSFLERVRAGTVNGRDLAVRLFRSTKSTPVKAMIEALMSTHGQQIRAVRVKLASVDDLNGQLGEFEASNGPTISISETPLTSEAMFSHFLMEELIHAFTHVAGEESQMAMVSFYDQIREETPGRGESRDALYKLYRSGEIDRAEYQVEYALTSPQELIAHAAITPAVQAFLANEGVWAFARGALADVFGSNFAVQARAFANEAVKSAKRPRERAAQRAEDAGVPHHTPAMSKKKPVEKSAFIQAWDSADPREFLKANRDKMVAGLSDDHTAVEAEVARTKMEAAADILETASDPTGPTFDPTTGNEIESRMAKRLRMSIASLFNPNLGTGAAYRMATEVAADQLSVEIRDEIGNEEDAHIATKDGINLKLFGTRAFVAGTAKNPIGMKAAESVRLIINRGLSGIGGGGRNKAGADFKASATRIEKVAKGLKPRAMLKALMANQLISVRSGLNIAEQQSELANNLRSARHSIAAKVLRGPNNKVREAALVEGEILKEIEHISQAGSVDAAMALMNGFLEPQQKAYREVLIDEFKKIRPDYRFITEMRGQPWEQIDNYIPYIVDDPNTMVSDNSKKGHDITDNSLISGDGEIGQMDNIGTGIQSGSLLRRGLPGNTEHYYRTPTISTVLSALANQQYEIATLAERMMTKSITRPHYAPDNEKLNSFYPPLVDDVRLTTEGRAMTSGHITNARNAIQGVAEKYHRADRSAMPTGDTSRIVRSVMKLAYYKALVGFGQLGIQTLPGAGAWLTASGTHAFTNGAQFFRNLGRAAPGVGTQREMIDGFIAKHASAFDTRVADANLEALTREQDRLFPKLSNKGSTENVASRVIFRALVKALGATEGVMTRVSNTTIGGAENLILRPMFLTEYTRRAIENGRAKDWNDDSIFKDNVDLNAVDHAMRIVDEFGAPSDPADRGSLFISQGGGQAAEIAKFAWLAFAGHQMTMASNMSEAYRAIKDGDLKTAYRLITNVALQGALYTYIGSMVFLPVRDMAQEWMLSLFGEFADEEEDKARGIKLARREKDFMEKVVGAAYGSIDDVAFPMVPLIGPFLSTPFGSQLAGGAIDLFKDDLVTDEHIAGFWDEENIAFKGKVTQIEKGLSVFGPAGNLVADMWEDGYMSLGTGFLQNADILIPDRAARKTVKKAFKAWQKRED